MQAGRLASRCHSSCLLARIGHALCGGRTELEAAAGTHRRAARQSDCTKVLRDPRRIVPPSFVLEPWHRGRRGPDQTTQQSRELPRSACRTCSGMQQKGTDCLIVLGVTDESNLRHEDNARVLGGGVELCAVSFFPAKDLEQSTNVYESFAQELPLRSFPLWSTGSLCMALVWPLQESHSSSRGTLTLRMNSRTAICMPRQMPRYGTWWLLAYSAARIMPSTPRLPKPPGTSTPSAFCKRRKDTHCRTLRVRAGKGVGGAGPGPESGTQQWQGIGCAPCSNRVPVPPKYPRPSDRARASAQVEHTQKDSDNLRGKPHQQRQVPGG